MSSTTRQYIIKHIDPETQQVVRERIIDAPNRAAAMAFAANTTIQVDLLGIADARRLASTPVEIATKAKASGTDAHPDQQSLLSTTGGSTGDGAGTTGSEPLGSSDGPDSGGAPGQNPYAESTTSAGAAQAASTTTGEYNTY